MTITSPFLTVERVRPRRASRPRLVGAWPWASISLAAADVLAVLAAGALSASLLQVLRIPIWAAGWREMGVLWIAIRLLAGLYPGYGLTPPEELRASTVTTLIAAMGHVAVVFAVAGSASASLAAAATWSIAIPLSWFAREACKSVLIRRRRFGAPVIIVGCNGTTDAVIRHLKADPGAGYAPVAVFDDSVSAPGTAVEGVPVLGSVRDALSVRFPYTVRHAIVTIPRDGHGDHREITQALAARYPAIGMVMDGVGWPTLPLRLRPLGSLLMLEGSNRQMDPVGAVLKRMVDLLVAIPLALATLPIVLAAGLAVKLSSPGPAFFAQEREGRGGRRIRVWKIRTMVPDAADRLAQYLAQDAEARTEWQRYMKLRRDPRIISGIGHLLRRYSLDELPQLWSVIRGEMSLVGPRPFPAYHLDMFPDAFRRLRRQVLPGLTGLWQVTHRSNGDLNVQEESDSYYIRSQSLWLDLWILLRTVGVVLHGAGAY